MFPFFALCSPQVFNLFMPFTLICTKKQEEEEAKEEA